MLLLFRIKHHLPVLTGMYIVTLCSGLSSPHTWMQDTDQSDEYAYHIPNPICNFSTSR